MDTSVLFALQHLSAAVDRADDKSSCDNVEQEDEEGEVSYGEVAARTIAQGVEKTGEVISCCSFIIMSVPGPLGLATGISLGIAGGIMSNYIAPAIHEDIRSPEEVLEEIASQFSEVNVHLPANFNILMEACKMDVQPENIGQVSLLLEMMQESGFKQDFGAAMRDSFSTCSAVTKGLQRASNGGSALNLEEAKSMLNKRYDDMRQYLEPQGCFGKSTIIEAVSSIQKSSGDDKAKSAFERLIQARAQSFAMVQTKLQLEAADCDDETKCQSLHQMLKEKVEDFQEDLCEIKENIVNLGLC